MATGKNNNTGFPSLYRATYEEGWELKNTGYDYSKTLLNIEESSLYVSFVSISGELVISTVERYSSCFTLSSSLYFLIIPSAIFTKSPESLSTNWASTSTPTVGFSDGLKTIFSMFNFDVSS